MKQVVVDGVEDTVTSAMQSLGERQDEVKGAEVVKVDIERPEVIADSEDDSSSSSGSSSEDEAEEEERRGAISGKLNPRDKPTYVRKVILVFAMLAVLALLAAMAFGVSDDTPAVERGSDSTVFVGDDGDVAESGSLGETAKAQAEAEAEAQARAEAEAAAKAVAERKERRKRKKMAGRVGTPVALQRALPSRVCPAVEDWTWYETMPQPFKCFDFNLFYIKGPKTGSSTLGGVARRLAARYGVTCVDCQLNQAMKAAEPRLVANHLGVQALRKVHTKSTHPVFTWAFVRDPVERCLSTFYHFEATRHGREPTPENIIAYAKTNWCTEFIFRYYDMGNANSRAAVDFMGVTERMHESLIVLAHLLGLSMGDLLYTSAKVSSEGVKDVTGREKDKILVPHVPLQKQTPDVRKWFKDNFRKFNTKEFKLYEDSNKRLDNLIDTIGRDLITEQAATFQEHQHTAESECSIHTDDGTLQASPDCYWRDNGCSIKCLDAYATEHDLWTPLAGPGSD